MVPALRCTCRTSTSRPRGRRPRRSTSTTPLSLSSSTGSGKRRERRSKDNAGNPQTQGALDGPQVEAQKPALHADFFYFYGNSHGHPCDPNFGFQPQALAFALEGKVFHLRSLAPQKAERKKQQYVTVQPQREGIPASQGANGKVPTHAGSIPKLQRNRQGKSRLILRERRNGRRGPRQSLLPPKSESRVLTF
ncbi:MAG: hypothetical protein KatS3mg007_1615 [Thermoanaerobaculum sp.]|nr:MAG: hypothetical protein KatS3mg007_1615 [Thermoanaerobaculum sp.]